MICLVERPFTLSHQNLKRTGFKLRRINLITTDSFILNRSSIASNGVQSSQVISITLDCSFYKSNIKSLQNSRVGVCKISIQDPSYLPYLPLFYILKGVKKDILHLLLNCFHVFQDSEQAPPAVVGTSFKYCFCLW